MQNGTRVKAIIDITANHLLDNGDPAIYILKGLTGRVIGTQIGIPISAFHNALIVQFANGDQWVIEPEWVEVLK